MGTVFCFGELLLRLSPRLNGAWIREESMPVFVGGAELNVATALALWGIPVEYGTALPAHYLSEEICAHLNGKGIGTDRVLFSGNRIGTYYLPQGADLKNAGVIYDRAYSSFWDTAPGTINWDQTLEGISWLHFSAISPALHQQTADLCLEAVSEASRRGITVSVDLNYRAKLWQYGKRPDEIMPALVQHCDVVMGNIWAAEKMLGISVPSGFSDKGTYLNQAMKTAATIRECFPKVKQVANTFRFDRGAGITYYATLHWGTDLFVSTEHQAEEIVDKVGSGDCFMAGLIYGNQLAKPPQEIIDFAAAAAFNKLFVKGDATTTGAEDIRKGYQKHA